MSQSETMMTIRARRDWVVRFACFAGKRLAYISPSLAAQLVNFSQRFMVLEYYTVLTGWQRLPAQDVFKVEVK